MLYLQTTSPTSETTHVFKYGTHQSMFFTAVNSDDYSTIEMGIDNFSAENKMKLIIRSDKWDSCKKTYLGIHRVFLTMESLNSYLQKFNEYYKQDNKLQKL